MSNTSIKYHVEFVGKIWLPAITCASGFTLDERDNARFTEPFNLNDPEEERKFVEHLLYGEKSGDFQSVSDYHCEKVVTTVAAREENGKRIVDTHSESTILREWDSEDNELAYADATSEAY